MTGCDKQRGQLQLCGLCEPALVCLRGQAFTPAVRRWRPTHYILLSFLYKSKGPSFLSALFMPSKVCKELYVMEAHLFMSDLVSCELKLVEGLYRV